MLHILQSHATTSTSGHGDPNLKRIQRISWPSWSFHFPHLRSELHGSFPQWVPATELPMGISIACVQEASGILSVNAPLPALKGLWAYDPWTGAGSQVRSSGDRSLHRPLLNMEWKIRRGKFGNYPSLVTWILSTFIKVPPIHSPLNLLKFRNGSKPR